MLSAFCFTMIVTSEPVFKSAAVSVAWWVNVVALVKVIGTFLPCKLVTCKVSLLTRCIVPVVTLRQAFVVVGVVTLLVVALELPQATSNAARAVNIMIGRRENILLINLLPNYALYAFKNYFYNTINIRYVRNIIKLSRICKVLAK